MRVLVTGGAGFVGSSLAKMLKNDLPDAEVVIFDNLKRRGSEYNLSYFKKHGMPFVHGDIRNPSDLFDLEGDFDLLIEASAEPSVHAGTEGSSAYLVGTNLTGTLHCLEFVRQRVKQTVFLSTSRVYSIEPLRKIALIEEESRFELARPQSIPGMSEAGISEEFPLNKPRSLYGATKLASELMIMEFVDTYGIEAVINRCGVIAGPGQFGKVDQGVFTLWVANHYFQKSLKYMGFGGKGKQVRDLLHPLDLYRLVRLQLDKMKDISGEIYNVGGGVGITTSLLELTQICQEVTGKAVIIEPDPVTKPVDIPYYATDYRRAQEEFGWTPKIGVKEIVTEIHDWIQANETTLVDLF